MHREILFSSDCGESWTVMLEDGEAVEAAVERLGIEPSVGNIYLGLVRRVLPGMQAAFVEVGADRTVFVHAEDIPFPFADETGKAVSPRPGIEQILREGQRLAVQITKEALPHKGARASLHLSLPGRLLVFSPTLPQVGVSRRIEDPAERDRLREAVGAFTLPGEGFIVRTAGAGASLQDLAAEAERLRGIWREVARAIGRREAPALLHREEDLLGRLLRDLPGEGLDAIVVEGEEAFERCRQWLEKMSPALAARLQRYSNERPLLEQRGVRAEIERALRPKIRLPSGGTIVITQTEALVAVDVNTSRYVGSKTLEETALNMNLEAAREIVRQIRLRDLGGIIVIDFIDLEEEASRKKLTEAIGRELARDRSRSRVLEISPFGLVQLTRKRSRLGLDRMLLESCPACSGSARVKSTMTLFYEIRREIARQPEEILAGSLEVKVHPSVADRIRKCHLELSAGLRRAPRGGLRIEEDPSVPIGRFALVPATGARL